MTLRQVTRLQATGLAYDGVEKQDCQWVLDLEYQKEETLMEYQCHQEGARDQDSGGWQGSVVSRSKKFHL